MAAGYVLLQLAPEIDDLTRPEGGLFGRVRDEPEGGIDLGVVLVVTGSSDFNIDNLRFASADDVEMIPVPTALPLLLGGVRIWA